MNFYSKLFSSAIPSRYSDLVARKFLYATISLGMLILSVPSYAAYILEVDTDGLNDGVLTFNSGFSFGGDTTTASQSFTSFAFGTSGGDSIFGGDGVSLPDTYVYTYTPSSDTDNLVITSGTDLGGGNLASGFIGGGIGTYRVYATWPYTTNVSGGLTSFTISTAGTPDFNINIDQNNKGNEWIVLGDILYSDLLSSITVTQSASSNSFVSMRSYGLLFERVSAAVPEPTTFALFGVGLLGFGFSMRRLPS